MAPRSRTTTSASIYGYTYGEWSGVEAPAKVVLKRRVSQPDDFRVAVFVTWSTNEPTDNFLHTEGVVVRLSGRSAAFYHISTFAVVAIGRLSPRLSCRPQVAGVVGFLRWNFKPEEQSKRGFL